MIGDRPQSMHDAEVVCRFVRRFPEDGLLQRTLHQAVLIGIQSEQRRKIHPAGLEQLQTIGLGPRHRLLVRKDLSLAKTLEPNPAEKTTARAALSLPDEHLMIDVERLVPILNHRALLGPAAEELGGAA